MAGGRVHREPHHQQDSEGDGQVGGWFAQFLRALDPKWVAALLIGLIGVGGAAHNQLELRDQQEQHQTETTAFEQRIVVLEQGQRKLRRELAEVRAYQRPGIKHLGSRGRREAEPASRGGLLAGLRKLWPWGNG